MKEKAICEICVEQTLKVIEFLEGNINEYEATKFLGSHLSNLEPLRETLRKARAKYATSSKGQSVKNEEEKKEKK